jgi:hypothetical protein
MLDTAVRESMNLVEVHKAMLSTAAYQVPEIPRQNKPLSCTAANSLMARLYSRLRSSTPK